MTTGLLVRLTGCSSSFSFKALNQKRPFYYTPTAPIPENNSRTLPRLLLHQPPSQGVASLRGPRHGVRSAP